MTTVISVENLSKVYRLGQIGTGTFSNDLKLWWAKTRGKPNPLLRIGETDHGNREGEDLLWALQDVSFTVEQGEVLGIFGKNGAGKSTLLKILSRVTAPTSGKVKVKGKIASLLEVGTGFHPELTGRENIYLNGAILGMNHNEINQKFDEIVDFSGVEKFIDTPVKRYSSGMYVRLAFGVAAHLDPEILVVDEVLAVGDVEFQKKCIGKMSDISSEGRTVLFVTHNMSALLSLCPRTVLLNRGVKSNDGETNAIVQEYLTLNSKNEIDGRGQISCDVLRANEEQFILHALRTLDAHGEIRDEYRNTEPIIVELDISLKKEIANLVIGIELKRDFGKFVFRSFHNDIEEVVKFQPGSDNKYRLRVEIPKNILNGGTYFIYPCVGIHRKKWLIGGDENVRGLAFSVSFNVPNPEFVYGDKKLGLISPLLTWRQSQINSE
jgi:lipopolysaccharide transport system ATP-binding protein